MKLTKKQLTQAVARYAHKHGFSASTVRAVTSLRIAAMLEYHEHLFAIQASEASLANAGLLM